MKYLLIFSFASLIFSCSPTPPDLSGLIRESRTQMEDLAAITGYTPRDQQIMQEYDQLSNQISEGANISKQINGSKYLKEDQKTELQLAIRNDINPDALKLALLGFYKPNMLDYNFPLDACKVNFSKSGTVIVNFYSSGLTNSVEFATSRQDYESGNLIRQDFEYGTTEHQLTGLNNGDSVFGHYIFPYFNFEEPRFKFSGKYEERSR